MAKQRKLLVVNPSGEAFGSEQSLVRLIDRSIFNAEVVCPPRGSFEKLLHELGIKTYALSFGVFSLKQNPLWHFGFIASFLRIVISARADAIVINLDGNSPAISIVAKAIRIPIIRFCRFEFEPKGLSRAEVWAWRQASAIICPSETVKRQVEQWCNETGLLVPVMRIFDTVDARKAEPSERQYVGDISLPKHPKLLGYVGRLHRGKRIEIAIETLAAVRQKGYDAGLWIIGEGNGSSEAQDYKNELRDLAKKLQIEHKVHFQGPLTHELIPQAMAELDLLLLPSESESFGMVLIEAWSVGTPTVSFKTGGAAEITASSSAGLLADVDDTGQFADLTISLLSDDNAMNRCSASGKSWVARNCDPTSAAHDFEKIVQNVTG